MYIERQNKTFQEALTSFCKARQGDWDECLTPYEFACNTSVNQSLGETPFIREHNRTVKQLTQVWAKMEDLPVLNHCRHPTLPVATAHKVPNLALEDFTQSLQNSLGG